MKIFQNENTIVVRDGRNIAVARRWSQEFCISCYKQGCRKEAAAVMMNGGRLNRGSISGSLTLFNILLRTAQEKWAGEEFYCDPSDDRRMRVYTRIMTKYNIHHEVSEWGILSFVM